MNVNKDYIFQASSYEQRSLRLKYLENLYTIPLQWADGAVKNRFRVVNDKICCLLFLLCMSLMISIMANTIDMSSNEVFLKTYDSSNNECGKDKANNYPFLYMLTYTEPYKSVCVANCPTFDYNQIKFNSEDKMSRQEAVAIDPLDFKDFSRTYGGLSRHKSKSLNVKEAFGYDIGWAKGYFTEEQFNAYTKRKVINCFSNNEFQSCTVDNKDFYAYDSYVAMNALCVPLAPKAALLFSKFSKKLNYGFVGDIIESIELVGWSFLITFGISLVLFIFIKWYLNDNIWIIITLLGFTFLAIGSFIIYNYTHVGPLNHAFNVIRIKYLQFLIDNRNFMIGLAGTCILCGFTTFVSFFRFRKFLHLALYILYYAAETTLTSISLLISAIFITCLQIAAILTTIYTVLRTYTYGNEIHNSENGAPFISFDVNMYDYMLIIFLLFSAYWLISVLHSYNRLIIAALTCNIYFRQTENIRTINLFCHCLTHHIGTVAWTIILPPITVLAIPLKILHYLIISDNPKILQRVLSKLLCPLIWLYENFIDRFSVNSLILAYMGSEGFIKANNRYYYLKEKYNDEIYVLTLLGDSLDLMCKLLPVFLATCLAYVIYANSIELKQNINNIGGIFTLIFVFSFIISSIIIELFSTTYSSLLICYLIERNVQDKYGVSQMLCPSEIVYVIQEVQMEKIKDLNVNTI